MKMGTEHEIKSISMSSILQSLSLQNVSLNVNDLTRYTMIVSITFALMIYIFPQHLLFILLCLVFIVLAFASLVFKLLTNIRNEPDDTAIRKKPINLAKLQQLRESLNKTKNG